MLISKAPPAAPLTIEPSTGEVVFRSADTITSEICMATLSGSSKLDLQPFAVTATGTIAPGQPGTLELVLLATPGDPNNAVTPDLIYPRWTAIAHTPPEPVGASDDFAETMWMVQGINLMYFLKSGKMQGTWTCNIAGHPTPVEELSDSLQKLEPDIDPIMMFAVSAIFTPTTEQIVEPYPTLTLASLTVTGSE